MFGSLVVLYLFLGGFGAGIVFIESIWSLYVKYCGQPLIAQAPFVRQRSVGLLVGTLALALGVACLAFDLGRPDRALYVLLRPTWSLLSVGSYLLMGALALAALLTWRSFKLGKTFESSIFHSWLCGIALVLCVGVMGYTGLYLQSIKSVAIWDTWLLPAMFIVSSASCGIAAVYLVNYFVLDGWRLEKPLHKLHGVHMGLLLIEGILLAIYVVVMAGNNFAKASFALLVSPIDYGVWFGIGLFVLCLLAPFFGEVYEFFVRPKRPLPAMYVLCILGGFLLRFCIVGVGLH